MVIYHEKEIRGITIGKNESILFPYDMIISLENHENQLRNLRSNKISAQWSNNDKCKKSKTAVLFTNTNLKDYIETDFILHHYHYHHHYHIPTNTIKYLRPIFTRNVENLYGKYQNVTVRYKLFE